MLDRAPITALPAAPALATALRRQLPSFHSVDWVEHITSTNAELMARARADATPKPWLLGAHHQSAGRGRAGRSWEDLPSSTLMFSCAFETDVPASQLPQFGPLAGLAACDALRALAGPAGRYIGLKWPNDLQWHDAKLAGILVESTRNPALADRHTLVMGIGLNLREGDRLSIALDRPIADWSCVTDYNGAAPALGAAALVQAIATAWRALIAERRVQDFSAFAERFGRVDVLAGRQVTVVEQGRTVLAGTACGVDMQGRLLVDGGQGPVPVSIGDVSVRARS